MKLIAPFTTVPMNSPAPAPVRVPFLNYQIAIVNVIHFNVLMLSRLCRNAIFRNISEPCKPLIRRHSLKNAGEGVLAVFFIDECDSGSMGIDQSGINFAKTIAKDSDGVGRAAISLDARRGFA
jgi:hypothetical protein